MRRGDTVRLTRRPSIVWVMSDIPRGAVPGRAVDRSVEDFDESYLGTPPWDIGRPQPMFAALLEEGVIRGSRTGRRLWDG